MSERLHELSIEEIERLRTYEAENKNRQTLLRRFDARIEAEASRLKSTLSINVVKSRDRLGFRPSSFTGAPRHRSEIFHDLKVYC